MSNGTLFSYSSPKFSLASDRDFFGRDTAPGLHPTTPTNAGPGSCRLLERCQGWRLQLRKQPGAAGLRAVRDWQTGGANLVRIWNKSEVFLFFKKHSIVEQMWNDSKPGLGKEKAKQHKWIFETYRASPGLRKWPSQCEASWPRLLLRALCPVPAFPRDALHCALGMLQTQTHQFPSCVSSSEHKNS